MNIRLSLVSFMLVMLFAPTQGHALPSIQTMGSAVIANTFYCPSNTELGSLVCGNLKSQCLSLMQTMYGKDFHNPHQELMWFNLSVNHEGVSHPEVSLAALSDLSYGTSMNEDSGASFDGQTFDLLSLLFVGTILIGFAGIIRRNSSKQERAWKNPSEVKVGHSYKGALSAET